MSVIDDNNLSSLPITDLERRKFYDDGSNSFVRTVSTLENDIKTNNSQIKTTVLDRSGNHISSRLASDGGHHLGTSIVQYVYSDDNNSSTTNLTSENSYTFTGTSSTTLGVVGLQWSLKTDQNATVYIEQSQDGTNWDISNDFDYITSNGGDGGTVQALSSYWRIRVVLTGTIDTTYFRLQGILCPIASPLPASLTNTGRLKSDSTITCCENLARHAWITPNNTLLTSVIVRLVGTNFDGTTKDTNFWTEAVTGSGSATQSGKIILSTGATANSTASYTSVRKARFTVGSALKFTGAFNFITAATTDNVRRFGAYQTTDGFFYQLDGSTFSVGTRKASSDTLVSSGNFNGNYGSTFEPSIGIYYKYEIEWSPLQTLFFVNNKLLHMVSGGSLSDFLTLPAKFENVNDNGNTTPVSFHCIGAIISREGELKTNTIYKYIAGASTTVCKIGAGVLHTIVNNDNSGSVIIYDNTAGSGNIIASIDLSKVLGSMDFSAAFNTGLTIVTTGSGAKISVMYE